MFVTFCPDNHVFVMKGKCGTCLHALNEAVARLASALVLRGEADFVAEQLKDIKCGKPHPDGKGGFVWSCPDAIARAITTVQNREEKVNDGTE